MTGFSTTAAPTDVSTLEANLQALARQSPRAAQAVREASAAALDWGESAQEGAPWAALDGRTLASRRRPLDEGERLASSASLESSGVIAMLGFALGYHLRALAQRSERHTLIVVYEPDVALLRAVFERLDHSAWLREHNVVVLTDESDRSGALAALRGAEALFAIGLEFLEHPPSTVRLGERSGAFSSMLAQVVEAFRTTVITTMVHTEVTIRNELMNAQAYVTSPGIDDLQGAAAGRAAIVVSAGPSLRRNIELLEDPSVRESIVIICVQTVLKTLLARGIKPHFVTALDYHEISRRFYEELTPEDVDGVTLVAEPKANSAIIDAWPGALRMVGSEMLDRALGSRLTGARATIEPGATVAHLAYYLARHLGCDPVILVGQDLAFTDGQYYAPGAAIHNVWACELNPFNTLETMEWQRIVRMRSHLQRGEDHDGRAIYTDDQMSTYLAQFERDFKRDAEHGLSIIDATEGGIRKAHTSVMPLAQALGTSCQESDAALDLPQVAVRSNASDGRALRKRLSNVRDDIKRVERLSREASFRLDQMDSVARDTPRLNALIEQVHELRAQVERLETAYWLVHRLNQTGALKRFKADRELKLQALDLDDRGVQARQIQRDRSNVEWLADAGEALAELLGIAIRALPPTSEPKLTRDRPLEDVGAGAKGQVGVRSRSTVGGLVMLDPEQDPFGFEWHPRFKEAFQRTLDRLARVEGIGHVVVATPRADLVRSVASGVDNLEVVPLDVPHWRARQASLRGARLWARACWRGGLGGMTIWDEAFDSRMALEAMEASGLDAALIVGADWPLVDPDLCSQAVRRHHENPAAHPLTFCQAPAGLAGCVIARELVAKLSHGRESGDPLASIGGVLGYRPTRPVSDPIGTSACVQIEPHVRDALARFTLDEPFVQGLLEDSESSGWSVSEIIDRWRESSPMGPSRPRELIVEVTARRGRPADEAQRPDMSPGLLESLVASLAPGQPRLVVTLGGSGDPLCHPEIIELIDAARRGGAAGVHVRTELACDETLVEALAGSGVDVVSIDLHANRAETYAELTRSDACSRVLTNSERLLALRRGEAGWLSPWVVPRILRCDRVLEEIEGFYDKSIYFASCGVIDQRPREMRGERIEPLGKPRRAHQRDALARMMVLSNGAVIADERDLCATHPVGNAHEEPALDLWRRLLARRLEALGADAPKRDQSIGVCWTGW